jgi:hypothetical protein
MICPYCDRVLHRGYANHIRTHNPKYVAPCGTNGGYQRHLRLRTRPCRPCKDAKADWQATYRRQTGETSARLRAVEQLVSNHEAEFLTLMEAESKNIA